MNSLYDVAARCLAATDPDAKCRQTHALLRDFAQLSRPPADDPAELAVIAPGRPQHLELVAPRFLKRRRLGSREGRATLIHALTHIEFNAINLALDAVYRFRGLPEAYYRDWVRVADEEATHFLLLRNHLRWLGYDYGDFPAHDGLWDMAVRTAADVEARMALVPRCLEARGLDVTPGIREKLLRVGDHAAAAILDTILRDEIGHVSVGDRWFKFICRQRRYRPETRFRHLLEQYLGGDIKGPYHVAARRQAGFSDSEIAYLKKRYG